MNRRSFLIAGQVVFWLSSLAYLLIAQPMKIGLLSYETGSMQWFLVLATLANATFIYGVFYLIINFTVTKTNNYSAKLLIIIAMSFVSVATIKWILYEVLVLMWLPESYPGLNFREWIFSNLFSTPYLAIVLSAGLYTKWNIERLNNIELANRATNAELLALQRQVNPHFLFNSLNTIYSLVVKEKAEQSTQAVMLLSELMRHVLASSDKQFVPLSQELTYLENYFEFQKLRLPKHVAQSIHLKITGEPLGHKIPPLLFVNYIENAFKYGISYDEVVEIQCSIDIKADRLVFSCNNVIHTSGQQDISNNLGLENANKRIQLTYPEKSYIVAGVKGDRYCVDIEIMNEG